MVGIGNVKSGEIHFDDGFLNGVVVDGGENESDFGLLSGGGDVISGNVLGNS